MQPTQWMPVRHSSARSPARARLIVSARRAARRDRRGVDENPCRRAACRSKRLQQLNPDTLDRPAELVVIKALLGSAFRRRVASTAN